MGGGRVYRDKSYDEVCTERDEWKARAKIAEAERDALREALERAHRFVDERHTWLSEDRSLLKKGGG